MTMIDTYLKSTNETELLALKNFLKNVMLPALGRAAKDAHVDEEGVSHHAQEAAGDPNYYYTCVRASFPVPAFDGVEACSTEEGHAVVGDWAS